MTDTNIEDFAQNISNEILPSLANSLSEDNVLPSQDLANSLSEDNVLQEEFQTIDKMTQDLHDCYQIQVEDDGSCGPILLGKYPEIPLPINKIIRYKKYLLHVVTYILTQEEIDNKLYKIVGVNVVRQNRKNSLCSLDFIYNVDEKQYQLIFCDHVKNTVQTVEKLEKFPGKDKVLSYIIEKAFEDPVKSVLLKK